jgi:histidinol-phosphate aminotransferase
MHAYHSPLSDSTIELRLDMNESTTGCSPRVLAKIRSLDAKTLALYPARERGEKLVADFLRIDPSQVLLTNGADEGIDLLCRGYLDAEDELIIVTPAFPMYGIFAQTTGAKLVRVPAADDFNFPTDQVVRSITPRTRLIVITNPNNPTGLAVDRADILRVLKAAPDSAVLLDEAYFDFYGHTLMDQIGKIPNLFIARTFSKAYGLAGMRLGVLAGAAEQIAVLRRLVSPFNINVFAIEVLAEALKDREFVEAYVNQVRSTREWLHKQLEAMGFHCWPSHTNFLLVNVGGLRAKILQDTQAKGIALRNRPDCEGCIRISIGTQQEMERVVDAMRQIVASVSPRELSEQVAK